MECHRAGRSSGDGQETSPKDFKKKNVSFKSSENHSKNVKLNPYANRDPFFSISEAAQKLSRASLFTAPDTELLNSPPPAVDQATKILLRPSIVPKACTPTSTPHLLSSRQRKEPKFVPYEPYKGCVKSIVGERESEKLVDVKQHIVVKSKPKLSLLDQNSLGNPVLSVDSVDKFKCIIKDFELEKLNWEKKISSLSSDNQTMKQDLKNSQKELAKLKQQLSTQSQVNSELKKLLVASVGEDVQGRVQCLAEDKERMATMIRKYSEKVDKDFEEKERISIQCDVWRSKFLAGSLLVDELARWKGTLMQRSQRLEEALRVLLQETEVSQSALISTFKHIRQIQDAFDPLNCEIGSLTTLDSADALSLSVTLSGLAEALRDRLLGDLGRAVGTPNVHLPDETKTPGQKMAFQALEHHVDLSKAFLTDLTSSRSRDCDFHHANGSKLTVNCCANCDGEIFVV